VASADLRLTSIYLGRRQVVYGAAIGPEQSWTPALSTGTIGTATENVAKWNRSTEFMDLSWRLNQSGGTGGSGSYLITVPDSKTIDLARKPIGRVVGYGKLANQADELSNSATIAIVLVASSNQLKLQLLIASTSILGDWGQSNYTLLGNLRLSFQATIPISQWTGSGTVQLAEQGGDQWYGNSEAVVNTNGVTGKTTKGQWTPILANTASTYYDITLDRPLLRDEVPKIVLRSKVDGNTVPLDQSSCQSLGIPSIGPMFDPTSGANLVGMSIQKINAGQVRVRINGLLGTNPSFTYRTWAQVVSASDGYDAWALVIEKAGGARQETPMVYATMWLNANTSVSANAVIPYTSVLEDSHSCLTTGASARFTCKIPGRYAVKGFVYNVTAASDYVIYKNGSLYGKMAFCSTTTKGTGSIELSLSANDYIDCRPNVTGTNQGNASFPLTESWLQITRIGA
jgi:hypothetical protein